LPQPVQTIAAFISNLRKYFLVLPIMGILGFAPQSSHAARIVTPPPGAVQLVQDDCDPECREHRRVERERAEAEHRRWEAEHHQHWEDKHHWVSWLVAERLVQKLTPKVAFCPFISLWKVESSGPEICDAPNHYGGDRATWRTGLAA
jgi:hypothetical protein